MTRRPFSPAVALLCALSLASLASAQEGQEAQEPQTRDVVELTRAVLQVQRQAIITNAMSLTESESAAFWPVYHEYHADVSMVNDRLAKLLIEYTEDPVNVTPDEADDMLADYLGIRAERIKLKQKYVKRFGKALPSIKLVRYYQLENKLDAAVDLELAKTVPLIW